MKKIALHLQIVIALFLGVVFSITSIKLGISPSYTIKYIKPFGDIFLNGLKAVAIPLVLSSLIVGITNLEDTSKLSTIGTKTVTLFFVTTIFSAMFGLFLANVLKPGKIMPKHTREKLMSSFHSRKKQKIINTDNATKNPLKILVDIIPSNVFLALTNTKNLLQVVFISIVFGIGLIKIPARKSKKIIGFFEGCNDAFIEIIKMIMKIAPLGIFALISSLLVEICSTDSSSNEIFGILEGLLYYMGIVIFGLLVLTYVVYPLILKIFTKVTFKDFFEGMRPAQLIAFTTSSSSAALPISMERVEKHLGVSEEVSSFVLPLGATINMNGSALYQGISILFIAQVLNIELSIFSQIMLVANVTMASIGAAGVPGASLVAVSMLLESMGIPAAGLALIFAPQRILDMFYTASNITGDAVVAVVVASSEGELSKGADKHLLNQDNY